jgi:hypothetical protein
MIKQYTISDLFINSWTTPDKKPTLSPKDMAALVTLRYQLDQAIADESLHMRGFYSIKILALLRKNKSAVAKINIDQSVDCINDITFFREPWYFFPNVTGDAFAAPDEYMHDRFFEQLVYADSAFSRYCVLEDQLRNAHPSMDGHRLSTIELDNLIAVLYTRPEMFNSRKISDRADLVASLDPDFKFLVFHTYANIREYIVKRCAHLFPAPSSTPAEERKIVWTGPMWRNLMFDFSETEAFSGFDRARTAYVYDALDYLDKKQKELNEAKAKQKTHA